LARLPATFNEKEKKSILAAEDVLLNIVGASIGRSAIADERVSGGNTNQAVAILRLVRSGVDARFLVSYLTSPGSQAIIHSEKVDVARANLSLADIRGMPIPLPPQSEQQRIIQEVDLLLPLEGETRDVVTKAFLRVIRLRQSILKWAFEGKLVDQDPNDEPASVLLERIRAERAAQDPPRARVRRRRAQTPSREQRE